MKVTIKLKQGRRMTIKIISTTPTWSSSVQHKMYCEPAPGGHPVVNTDSRSPFYFPHDYGIEDFRRLVSISHTINVSLVSVHIRIWMVWYITA